AQFHGQHKHVFGAESNLNAADDNYFNDKVSSLVVLEGNWAVFADSNFKKQYPPILGPGLYPVLPAGVKNDDMSSLKPVDAGPTVSGGPVNSHVMLFEHANFHGAHKHVFTREPNLNASDDNFFNDKVSSLVVLEGNWAFYADSTFRRQYPPILRPGVYPGLPAGIRNVYIFSLHDALPISTVSGGPVNSHVMLFEHVKFHGAHKHVFTREPNLNASDDNFFNDKVSSLVVLERNWAFYADSGFHRQYPPILRPGLYLGLPTGIKNDDMSSLQVVNALPSFSGAPVNGHVTLFLHDTLPSSHKHVFTREPNLNASDDNFFNDKVSSFHILSGLWVFYRDSGFQNAYAGGTEFGP